MSPESVISLETLKGQLAAALPQQAEAALKQYQSFTAQEPPSEAKAFAAHFSAAKAALSHLDVLIKLIGWAENTPDSTPENDLVAQARQALSALEADEP